MPGCCFAPNCSPNYVSGPKVRVYRFPFESERRTAWTKAIPCEDFAPTKYSVLRRLKPCVTPNIFPNCPAYLSRNRPAAREGPEEKRSRLKAEALQEALTLSTEAYDDEQRKNFVSSFDELVTALKEFQVADFWTKLVTDKQVLFLNFAPRDAPVVRYSVTVSADLSLRAFFGDLQLDKVASFGPIKVPVFFILDTVHVPKCVRDNWLNQRNSRKCMFFPILMLLVINHLC
ncbi:hypothetical protein HPB47_004915 [Ixodes persulcatus]|uniref:Uncharacterized protein n=1 Tax=Ixodes persulcatus TaxID=34615 RepID=A0AC60PEH8_IXOPE|nr:hypothetical protein HPB47_004915 [Ixodes persulcatus]